MRPTQHVFAVLSLLALAACDGNPFPPGTPGGGTDNPPPDNDQAVTVPANLQGDIQKVVYTPATGTKPASLQIQITGLDTTPLLATWDRNASLDVPGYTAFSIQQSSVDRMFIGLAAVSADNSVSAQVAGDGGLNNTSFSGSNYTRTGAYTPPTATGTTGSVHYAGSYAGLMNGGGSGTALIPPPAGLDPTQIPGQAARVTGDVALTANFADNQVEGQIFNRVVVDSGFGLESVILVPTSISTNGTFEGVAQRPDNAPDVVNVPVGTYGGVFGGSDANSVAGGVSLRHVYDTVDAGSEIDGALERGVFVLSTCAPGATTPPGCVGTSP
jgi:hypothetical protein